MEINLNTLQTPDDFLTFLIALGEKAKAFRQARNLCAIDWPTLKRNFFENAYPPPSLTSRADHDRWLLALQMWADQLKIASPIVPNKVRHRKPHPLLIPLTEEAESIVRERMTHVNAGYLFPDKCRQHSSRQLDALFKLAKIKKIGNGRASFHSLRATFISLMDEAGIQPYITDAITGHAAGGMHARYTQPELSILRRSVLRAIPRVRTGCP